LCKRRPSNIFPNSRPISIDNTTPGQIKITNTAPETGDVVGPASATDSAVVLYDGTTGKLIKNSAKTLPAGVIVGTTDAQALTNKSINGVTPSTAGPATQYLDKTGNYSTPAGGIQHLVYRRGGGASGVKTVTADLIMDWQGYDDIADTSIVTLNGGNTDFTLKKTGGLYKIYCMTWCEGRYVIFSGTEGAAQFLERNENGAGWVEQQLSWGTAAWNQGDSSANDRGFVMISTYELKNAVAD